MMKNDTWKYSYHTRNVNNNCSPGHESIVPQIWLVFSRYFEIWFRNLLKEEIAVIRQELKRDLESYGNNILPFVILPTFHPNYCTRSSKCIQPLRIPGVKTRGSVVESLTSIPSNNSQHRSASFKRFEVWSCPSEFKINCSKCRFQRIIYQTRHLEIWCTQNLRAESRNCINMFLINIHQPIINIQKSLYFFL